MLASYVFDHVCIIFIVVWVENLKGNSRSYSRNCWDIGSILAFVMCVVLRKGIKAFSEIVKALFKGVPFLPDDTVVLLDVIPNKQLGPSW